MGSKATYTKYHAILTYADRATLMTRCTMADFRTQAAIFEADCDREWRSLEEVVDELEHALHGINDKLVLRAVGLVVVQCHLNNIKRDLDEMDYGV